MNPQIIKELIDLIGEEQTRILVKQRGGGSLFISNENNCPFDELNQSAWELLCQQYKGITLYIPRCYVALLHRRDEAIRAAKAEGKSINWLVQKFQLSNRRIIDICGDNEESKQTSWIDSEAIHLHNAHDFS